MKKFLLLSFLLSNAVLSAFHNTNMIHIKNNCGYFLEYEIYENNIKHNIIHVSNVNIHRLIDNFFTEVKSILTKDFPKDSYYENKTQFKDIKHFLKKLERSYCPYGLMSISCDLMTIKKTHNDFMITKSIIGDVMLNYDIPVNGYFYFSEYALNDTPYEESPFKNKTVYKN